MVPTSDNDLFRDQSDVDSVHDGTSRSKHRFTLYRILCAAIPITFATTKLIQGIRGEPVVMDLDSMLAIWAFILYLCSSYEAEPPARLRWFFDTTWDGGKRERDGDEPLTSGAGSSDRDPSDIDSEQVEGYATDEPGFPSNNLNSPASAVKKRPRRRYDEIERFYHCTWPGCTKAYGTLNHLNSHVKKQKHGPKRSADEFSEAFVAGVRSFDRDTDSSNASPAIAVKSPRRRGDEIDRPYHCTWPGCTKAYGALKNLNAHIATKKHGPRRRTKEFKALFGQQPRAKNK